MLCRRRSFMYLASRCGSRIGRFGVRCDFRNDPSISYIDCKPRVGVTMGHNWIINFRLRRVQQNDQNSPTKYSKSKFTTSKCSNDIQPE